MQQNGKRKKTAKPWVTSITKLCLTKFSAKLHLPLNTPFCKRLEHSYIK